MAVGGIMYNSAFFSFHTFLPGHQHLTTFTTRTKSYPNCLTILSSSFPEFKTVKIFPISFLRKLHCYNFCDILWKDINVFLEFFFISAIPKCETFSCKNKPIFPCLKSCGMGCNEDKSVSLFLLQKEGTHVDGLMC